MTVSMRKLAVLSFIGKNIGKLPGEIIDGHKQIFARFIGGLPLQQGKPLGIEVNKLAWVRLVIALGVNSWSLARFSTS